MKDLVCNYAPVRFLPYRETGEFVNVVVVVYFPEINYQDFKLETRRTERMRTGRSASSAFLNDLSNVNFR
jgi:hypothetical protein